MTVEIPPEYAEFVQSVIDGGSCRSEAEVVGEALRLLQRRNRYLREIRGEIRPALDRLDCGEGKELDLQRIKARGLDRLAAEGGSE